jgi:hypothetical protein
LLIKYTGEIEGQYGSREDPKKLAVIQEIPGNTGELVTLGVTVIIQTKIMMIKHAEQAIVKQQENSVSKANIQR